jgi:N-acetylneuraminate synthase
MGISMKIGNKQIGSKGDSVYIIAELSANHNQNIDQARELIKSAQEAGADAVKLQTYTADTLTLKSNNEYFRIGKGTLWEGKTLYDLYTEASTPWDWHEELKNYAQQLGLHFFSTPFDSTAIEFLEELDVPAYKVASFEIIDIPLIQKIARTKKPVILSTGMASVAEIYDAVTAIREEGNEQIALLKCTSAYPARADDMNLKTIPHMSDLFGVPVGISDHTLGTTVPVAAVALGACIVEKHLTLSRNIPGPDSAFSLEPHEFKAMVEAIRVTEKSLGSVSYSISEEEQSSKVFRRSLFVVKDMVAGETFTPENLRSIRPGYGLPPKNIDAILGRNARVNISRGTPMKWDLVE